MVARKSSKKVKRRLAFSILPSFLQLKIADKMEFFDQIRFEYSSKIGKTTVASVKIAPIIEVPQLFLGSTEEIQMKTHNRIRMGNWSRSSPNIRQAARLPRFKVEKILLCGLFYISESMELFEKTEFVPQDLSLWMNTIRNEETKAFFRISEKFTIKECSFNYTAEPDIFSEPEFQKIEYMKLDIFFGAPSEALLQLQSTTIILNYRSYTGQDPCVVTLFIQQWRRKERTINKLEITAQERLDCKTLISQLLPIMDVRTFAKQKAKFRILLKFMEIMELENAETKEDFLYSIDRGDKKLMLLIHPLENVIIAKEYTNLKNCPSTKRISVFD